MTSTARHQDEFQYLVDIRREIHRWPELGFEEERTAALVERELDRLKIPHRRVVGTGVVGLIEGGLPGAVAGLRADMDALPIPERTGLPFASEIPDRMHACGHDAHVAMLLGAARRLVADRAQLRGKVVLLFQPAEEGPGGARPMVEAGVLEDPHVDALAMLHVDSRFHAGSIGLTAGASNAACDELHITIEGRGGHGAAPHLAVDAIPAAAAAVMALQNIAARETNPMQSVVVTIGTIQGGYRNNAIADRVRMTGTLRSHDPELRAGLEARVRRLVTGVAGAYGATAHVDIIYGYPPVVNDPALVAWFRPLLAALPGVQVLTPEPTMGGEDFAYFAQARPSLLMRLGVRNEAEGAIHSGHSPEFRIDEAALPFGAAALERFASAVGASGGRWSPSDHTL
jgi:amidohydrolase